LNIENNNTIRTPKEPLFADKLDGLLNAGWLSVLHLSVERSKLNDVQDG
jgi:hypothetical protein